MPRGFARDAPAAYLRFTQFLGAGEEPPDFALRPDFHTQLPGTTPLCRCLNAPLLGQERPAGLSAPRRGRR